MVAEKQTHDINLHNVNLFLHDEFHDAFRILRREAPVHWNPGSARANGFWSLTKYEDILFVSRNPETFISSRGIAGSGERTPDPEEASEAARQPGTGSSSIITMDPPRHVKLRRLVNKGFTPRAVNAMEPQIRSLTREVLDEVGDRPSGDFVLEVSSQLPLAVICGLMGLPREAWPLMFELTNAALGAGDPEYQQAQVGQSGSTEAAKATARAGNAKMAAYFRETLAQRRAEPQDDLISTLLEAEVDGEQLTEGEILAFCNLLAIAGNETTRNAISGGMVALHEHPDQRERLQSDMSLIDSAVEEILRWTSPLHHMTREATADVEIRGQQISAGEKVLMWYPSANRDEDVFDDPYAFHVTREPNNHVGFGGPGPHFCLGANLARQEIKVMFKDLFRFLPDIEMASDPQHLQSNFINGLKHMTATFKPIKAA
jgi:cytochrome P450